MAKAHDVVRAQVTVDEKRRAKALCALNGWDLQDWAGEAVRRRLLEDEAARARAADAVDVDQVIGIWNEEAASGDNTAQ